MSSAVLIVSGGMDSVTLAYHYAKQGYALHLLSVHYGQRHARELACARAAATALGARWDLLDLRGLTALLTGNALTDASVSVPEGHYAAENMKATVVPNRNAMMLSAAVAVAVAEKAELVGTGVHAGDHYIYPDCRPEFLVAMDRAARLGNEGFAHPDFHIEAPFITWTKTAIAAHGHKLGVPFGDTWSCYVGGAAHCGKCGTCTERIEAFRDAGIPDPTVYLGNTL